MKIFKILNVGQGDSILIRPPYGCINKNRIIFVDLGSGKVDITKEILDNQKVHIFLTHHDSDHLGGLHFFMGNIDQIDEITVPLYQNEITLIARAILNLKGIATAKDCNEFISALEEIATNQVIVKSLVNGTINGPKLSFAYEGKKFCDHIECLNPPMHIKTFDWIHNVEKNDLMKFVYEFFNEAFVREMEMYIRAQGNGHKMIDMNEFNSMWLFSEDEIQYELEYAKCNYVFDFIMKNITLFRKFNEKSTRDNLRKIYVNYVKCTHDVCVVLRTSFDMETFLLTGDASKKVFNRFIKEDVEMRASYLKIPHHGSKHNMNKKILDRINPKVAIISHNNGHFGKAKDTHPHMEIVNLLSQKEVKILLTNDVIKAGVTIMKKKDHNKDYYVDIS